MYVKYTDKTYVNHLRRIAKKYSQMVIAPIGLYKHTTFKVNSLTEYIELVSSISNTRRSSKVFERSLAYRGLPDESYSLIPSLGRIDTKGTVDLVNDIESRIINDFIAKRPDEFNGLYSFDTIAKMQHYGLPTRLLDFSLNPLIALYFTCESKNDTDGRVVCHSCYLDNTMNRIINKICDKAIENVMFDKYFVEDYYCDSDVSLDDYMRDVYISDDTLVIQPKYWNERIRNQEGIFMVFPNDITDSFSNTLVKAKTIGIDKAIEDYYRGNRDPKYIYDAMEHEPVSFYSKENNCYLTNECYRRMRYSYKNVDERDDCKDRFNKRFRLESHIKPLSNDQLDNQFCSIIINHTSKKKILKELSTIGYGIDFIYPELEYVAKEIKRKYDI